MEFRRLGRSGLSVSEISYGNWITHGSPGRGGAGRRCVHAALDAGITTFDTADVYANTRAESVLGRALAGQRRESLEIFTKVFWPTGPGGPNDRGLSPQAHHRVRQRAHCSGCRPTTSTSTRRTGSTTSVPLEETLLAFADLVRAGKVLYIGVSEWTADQIARGAELARELKVPFISNQPQYSMLWRVIEAEVIPASEREGISQIVWSPLAQGVLTGKYLPGQPCPPARAPPTSPAARLHQPPPARRRAGRRSSSCKPIAEDVGLSMAQLALAWVLQNKNVASAIIGATRPEQVKENVKASGVTLDAGDPHPNRQGPGQRDRNRPVPHRLATQSGCGQSATGC